MEDCNARAYRDTQNIDQTFPYFITPPSPDLSPLRPHYDYTSNRNGPCDIECILIFSTVLYLVFLSLSLYTVTILCRPHKILSNLLAE